MSDVDQILAQCTNIMPGHGRSRVMKQVFQSLADGLAGDEVLDSYGSGAYLANFESEVAAIFDKPAAVFMPTGTMVQQIALRIWCGRRANNTVAMHPTAHPETAEHGSYRFMHNLQRVQFGAPEWVGDRMLTVRDFEEMGQMPGAVLLELPYRPLGGQLPAWDDLVAISTWARAHQIPLHMDGARIWASRPFYGPDFTRVAALFDSLYVSFYKDLGGLSGAMLLGPADFIQEARVWQKRHGGQMYTLAPYIVAARLGLQRTLPQIDSWVSRAREVAVILSRFDRITINPNPPHVNFFQIYIRGDHDALTRRHMDLAQETGTFLFYGLGPSPVPGIAVTELHCWENAAKFDLNVLAPFVEKLLA